MGQNVNSYGRDLPSESRIGFAELLARVDAVEGIDRIRYTSPHPKDMKEDVIRAHAELPSVCEHIHLPLQSGSSAILKRMRRTYDRQRYMDRVSLIREHVPDCAITTDIIVGFPGETEADFDETLEVVDEVGYDSAFTFVFSPRRETEAAEMDGQVPIIRSRSSGWSGSSSWCSGGPRNGRSGSSGGRWRCSSKARVGPTRRDCAGGRGTTRLSTSKGDRAAARVRVSSTSRSRTHLATARRGAGSPSLNFFGEAELVVRQPFGEKVQAVRATRHPYSEAPRRGRHIWSDRGRQDRRRHRACGGASEAR